MACLVSSVSKLLLCVPRRLVAVIFHTTLEIHLLLESTEIIHGSPCNLSYNFDYVDGFLCFRLLEGMLRSINNLLERFHQSFFFYILPSPERYISISKFMPVTGLMAAAVLIKV